MKRLVGLLFVSLLMTIAPSGAWAQAYPTRPIHFVIGFPPGTVIDVVARLVGNQMSSRLGQPIVLDFKPGASGTIGAKYVVNAAPDGYTLYYGNLITTHPLFNRENAVDASRDFAPVSRFVAVPYFFMVRSTLPVQSFRELVAYSKANAGSLTYGAPSQPTDLLMLMLDKMAGLPSRGIPYKGAPQAAVALRAAEVDLGFGPVQPYLPFIQAGGVRALFVAAAKRSPVLANVPTAAEAGLSNFDIALNFGLWAPLRTPQEITSRLSAEAAAVLRVPSIGDTLRNGSSAEPVGSTPDEQLRAFEAEVRFWTEAARLANFQPQ